MLDEPEFDPFTIMAALERHAVRYVIVGGIAAQIAGAPIVTRDLDVTPAGDRENLERLAGALAELDARILLEGAPPDLEIILDAETIAGYSSLALSTPYGRLDLVLLPTGTRGYTDLARAATREVVTEDGLVVSVAALADVIRSKAAAGREKDQAQLPILRTTLEQLRRLER